MDPRLADLWSFEGTIDRGPYAFWGVVLALLKYNLDRVLVGLWTHQALDPFTYWVPGDVFGAFSVSDESARAALPLLVLALPFIWSGIVLTLRRTRAVHMPLGSVLLFFVPVVNLLFFAILCVLPSKDERPTQTSERAPRWLDGVIPDSVFGSAAMSLLIVLPITSALAWLSASHLREYGWGLFVGLPFFLGLASALLHGYRRPRSFWSCAIVATTAAMLLACLLIGLAFEGLLCILMAAPLAIALALFGGFIGYLIQRRPDGGRDAGTVVSSLVLVLPGVFGAERIAAAEPTLREIRSSIVVDAPPEVVWHHVVSFAELPPPTELLFRAGVAYPLRAEIDGTGPGAVRHCVFSTGPFVEPMPGGRTRLEGTTWYTNRMWPEEYWRIFSDEIIHRIHLRVLEHIRGLAEG